MKKFDLNLPKKRYMAQPAARWKRIVAFWIDIFIISIITYPLHALIPIDKDLAFLESINAVFSTPDLRSIVWLTQLASSLITLLYFMILEYGIQRTPGKILLKLEIISEKGPLRLWKAFVRNMFIIPFIPFNLLAFVDPIVMFIRKDKKRFSEMISYTQVIEHVALT